MVNVWWDCVRALKSPPDLWLKSEAQGGYDVTRSNRGICQSILVNNGTCLWHELEWFIANSAISLFQHVSQNKLLDIQVVFLYKYSITKKGVGHQSNVYLLVIWNPLDILLFNIYYKLNFTCMTITDIKLAWTQAQKFHRPIFLFWHSILPTGYVTLPIKQIVLY